MIEIKRKDLPLNTSMTFFECILNEPEMDKQIIKEIDEQGDRLKNSTYVNAQMTEWFMAEKPGFNKLANMCLDVSKKISLTRYNVSVRPVIKSMWGIKYRSNESTGRHDHWPAAWSFTYYINPPKDAPGLFFPEMGEQGGERKLEPGLLLFCSGHILHEVRKKKFKGYRYTVAGNIYVYDK